MQTQINVKCTDQSLKLSAAPVIASGGVNENVITFEFCSLWNDFKKVAVFWREEWLEDAEKKPLPIALDENNSCVVPWEVTADAGVFFFGVLGVLGEVERTSNVLEYDVSQGVIRGEYAMPATKDLFAQLVEASHTHNNKKTLDMIHCKAVERTNPFDIPLLSDSDLTFGGDALRLMKDGAVVREIKKVIDENGKQCLRLYFHWSNGVILEWQSDFIDIPISDIKEKEEEGLDFTLNGGELDLGFNALEETSHTHENKALLDTITEDMLGGVTEEEIATAVENYLAENPIESGLTVTDDGNGNVTIA